MCRQTCFLFSLEVNLYESLDAIQVLFFFFYCCCVVFICVVNVDSAAAVDRYVIVG